MVNIRSNLKPQNINLGLGLSSDERLAFIHPLKKYKNVFTWNYGHLKTYNPSITDHNIQMILDVKPVQQKLRKMHQSLESQNKIELNKLLKSKIIFLLGILNGFQIEYLSGRRMVIFTFALTLEI